MSGLFGGDTAKDSQRAQQQYAASQSKKTRKQTKKDINQMLGILEAERPRLDTGVSDARARAAAGIAAAQNQIGGYLGAGSGLIASERDRLANIATQLQGGLKPVNYSGPGYGIQMNNDGTIAVNRTGENQGFIDKLLAGMAADEESYGGLLSQLIPGYGALTQARKTDIENQARAATGNLREQLARRRVLGASFANDQVASLQAQYDQMRDKAIAESKIEELKMTQDVIGARTTARQQAIAEGLSQLQFEGNMGAQLTQLASTNLQNLQQMQIDIAKISAGLTELGVNLQSQGLTANTDLAKLGVAQDAALSGMGIEGNLNLGTTGAQLQTSRSATGANIQGNLANTVAGSFPEYAQLQSQIDAGPMNFLGTLAGAAMTAPIGTATGGTTSVFGRMFGG